MAVTVYTNPRTGQTVALDETRPELVAAGWTLVTDQATPAAVAAIAELDARRDYDAHVAELIAQAEANRAAAASGTVDPQQITDALSALTGQPSGLAALDAGGDVPADELDNVTLTKADVGLGALDNTADVDKPVSTAQAAADNLRLLKTADLSDLASAATARTNLGLGNAATRNVGASAGTVAAGDDARFGAGGAPSFASIFKLGTGA